jgi:hypothetical protein
MIRQLPAAIAACCVLCTASSLLAGCGGGAGASAASATPQAATPITKAQATGYAHAVNLRAADVPGLASFSSEHELPAPQRLDFEFARCIGGVNPARAIVNTLSPQFSLSGGPAAQAQFEESRVQVWPTPGLAANNYAAYQSSRGRSCFLRDLEASREQLNRQHPEQFQHGRPTVVTVPITLPGVRQSFLRTKVVPLFRGGRLRIRIYHDVFTFIYGPAEIELEATGFSHPVPSGTEERLLLLLLSRAKASKL